VSIRVNPGVEEEALGTHKHIATGHDEAKFGVAVDDVPRAIDLAASSAHLSLVGMTCHVGSQLTQVAPYVEAARTLFGLARHAMTRAPLAFVDTGGGFGIDYGNGCPANPGDFVRAVRAAQKDAGLEKLALHVEPGRALVAAHGVLVARVIQPKVSGPRRWLMIDAGMNDLMRPALYQARHRVVPLSPPAKLVAPWRVVGPVCESSDDFGVQELPDPAPELVALLDAGAYGSSMASRYNGRALPAEAFVRGGAIVARRERRADEDWIDDRAKL
jgi:diaminopimelate decarboxylase